MDFVGGSGSVWRARGRARAKSPGTLGGGQVVLAEVVEGARSPGRRQAEAEAALGWGAVRFGECEGDEAVLAYVRGTSGPAVQRPARDEPDGASPRYRQVQGHLTAKWA